MAFTPSTAEETRRSGESAPPPRKDAHRSDTGRLSTTVFQTVWPPPLSNALHSRDEPSVVNHMHSSGSRWTVFDDGTASTCSKVTHSNTGFEAMQRTRSAVSGEGTTSPVTRPSPRCRPSLLMYALAVVHVTTPTSWLRACHSLTRTTPGSSGHPRASGLPPTQRSARRKQSFTGQRLPLLPATTPPRGYLPVRPERAPCQASLRMDCRACERTWST